MKIVLAGAGAFGIKHLDAIKVIGGINVVSLIGRELESTRATAAKYGIPIWCNWESSRKKTSPRTRARDPSRH
jgi:2-hydroxy-4-carboxymuconate semialdehyde hemiacetal dehydrogenase